MKKAAPQKFVSNICISGGIFDGAPTPTNLEKRIATYLAKPKAPAKAPAKAAPVQFSTISQLAKECETPETSFYRLLDRHGIKPDVRVGSRLAFSKALSDDIYLWSHSIKCARIAVACAEYDGTSPIGTGGSGLNPVEKAHALDVAKKLQARADARLAKILSRNSPKPKTK